MCDSTYVKEIVAIQKNIAESSSIFQDVELIKIIDEELMLLF